MKRGEDWKVLIKNNGEGAKRYPRLMKFASVQSSLEEEKEEDLRK